MSRNILTYIHPICPASIEELQIDHYLMTGTIFFFFIKKFFLDVLKNYFSLLNSHAQTINEVLLSIFLFNKMVYL